MKEKSVVLALLSQCDRDQAIHTLLASTTMGCVQEKFREEIYGQHLNFGAGTCT